MATSSITHNFIISNPAAAERFANALEKAEKNKAELKPAMSRHLTNPTEILNILRKREKNG